MKVGISNKWILATCQIKMDIIISQRHGKTNFVKLLSEHGQIPLRGVLLKMRLIDADALKRAIATIMPSRVEVNLVVDDQPDAIVRCKDCKHRPKEPNLETYESGFDLEFPEGSKCPCRCCDDEWYSWRPDDNWYCANGEPKDS